MSFFKKDYNEIKSKINSNYYRSFKNYYLIERNSFTFNMLQKYEENIYDHYNDIEYVEACIFFYKINGKNIANIFKKILEEKYNNVLSNEEFNVIKNCNNILDLGAGIGATTIDMKNVFSNSNVYYTNLKSKQFNFFNYLIDKEKINICAKENYNNLSNIDIVLSLDYFEHFKDFEKEVVNIIEKLNPKVIVDTSDFSHAFVGHFENYDYKNSLIFHKKCSKIFENILLDYKYKRHNLTKLMWNSKPKFYFKEI